MEAVWLAGEATVHQVRDRLRHRRELAYTTVLSAMQKLETLGWLHHRADGRAYVYGPTDTRKLAGLRSVRKLTDRVFGGDRLLVFQHLLDDEHLTEQELDALKKMIDQRREA